MKRYFLFFLLAIVTVSLAAQADKTNVLQDLEKGNKDQQQTATLKYSSRLFGEKDDMTTVIMVIPSGSTVTVLGSDSTYYNVAFNDDKGFIFKRDAVIDDAATHDLKAARQMYNQQQNELQTQQLPASNPEVSRLSNLETKYGLKVAALISAGKIWKGMSPDMIRDSWGEPAKVSKTFEGNMVKEEWVYKNTWLYIENNILKDWGPIEK